ncbi:MAG: O-acetyl-ADP-ribose deacetylase [Bacteroidota bacterium]
MDPKISVLQGDLTLQRVDAIVNAANSSLMGGGGVDGAIHRAGGPAILADCQKIIAQIGSLEVGKAVITTGGNLSAHHVIHTVGPVWKDGNQQEPQLLADAYRNSLQLALDHKLGSIAFPNISTGIFGFPKTSAAKIAYTTVYQFVSQHQDSPAVTFVCFDEDNFKLYNSLVNG